MERVLGIPGLAAALPARNMASMKEGDMARRANPVEGPPAGQTAAVPAKEKARRGKAGRPTSFAEAPGPRPRPRAKSAKGMSVDALIDRARNTLLGDAW